MSSAGMDDFELLREFAAQRSEEAFRTLVERRIDFVFSLALRQMRDPTAAEEVTQTVFIDLADKAAALPPGTILAGWLFRAVRFACAKAVRTELRRQRREREAVLMQSTPDESTGDAAWQEMQPVLNEALDELSEADRCAVLLRFFEKRSLKEVADALALSEDAAKKRVARAVEKLRLIFQRRSVVLPTAVLLAALSAQTSNAAPVGLAASVATGAVLHASVASASTLTITQTLLKVMALSKLKTLAVGAAALLVVGGTTTYVVHEHLVARAGAARESDDAVLRIIDSLNSAQLDQAPPLVFLRPSRDSQRTGMIAANGRMMGRHVGLRELLASAYGTSQQRIVLPEGTADLHFDFLVSLPAGQQEALQAAIAEKVGLLGRVEKRDVNVYVLTLSEGEFPGRQPNVEGGRGMSVRANDGAISIENGRLDGLARTIETHLGCPVVDESRVKDRYDMTLTWDVQGDDAERSGLRRAVAEELGLELKRAKRLLDFLIVEPMKRW